MGNIRLKLLLTLLFLVHSLGCSSSKIREPQSIPLDATECENIPNEFNQAINKMSDLNLKFQQQDVYSKIHTSYLLAIHTACTSKMSPEARVSFCKRTKSQSHNSKYDFLSLRDSLSSDQYTNTSQLLQRAEKIVADFCD